MTRDGERRKTQGRRRRADRYGAKLLFQWRPVRAGRSKRFRLCEERTIVLQARSAEDAWRKANEIGRRENFSHPIPHGKGTVHFEFVGIVGLEALSSLDDHEVYYELLSMVAPMERRDVVVPRKKDLGVFGGGRTRARAW